LSDAGLDGEALYVDLDKQRRAKRLRWRGVAREVGVSPSMLTRLSQGHHVSADGLVRLMLWLGTTDLERYIRRGTDD
jgi:transcriptional regulator with XRE-family HTH domain